VLLAPASGPPFATDASALAVQCDGRIVSAGGASPLYEGLSVERYLPNGTPVPTSASAASSTIRSWTRRGRTACWSSRGVW
jgi:hypothetical protein